MKAHTRSVPDRLGCAGAAIAPEQNTVQTLGTLAKLSSRTCHTQTWAQRGGRDGHQHREDFSHELPCESVTPIGRRLGGSVSPKVGGGVGAGVGAGVGGRAGWACRCVGQAGGGSG